MQANYQSRRPQHKTAQLQLYLNSYCTLGSVLETQPQIWY